MLDLVGNPEDRFSRVEAQMIMKRKFIRHKFVNPDSGLASTHLLWLYNIVCAVAGQNHHGRFLLVILE